MQTEINGFSAYRISSKWVVFTTQGRFAFATKAKAEMFMSHRYAAGLEGYEHTAGCYCHSLTTTLPRGY